MFQQGQLAAREEGGPSLGVQSVRRVTVWEGDGTRSVSRSLVSHTPHEHFRLVDEDCTAFRPLVSCAAGAGRPGQRGPRRSPFPFPFPHTYILFIRHKPRTYARAGTTAATACSLGWGAGGTCSWECKPALSASSQAMRWWTSCPLWAGHMCPTPTRYVRRRTCATYGITIDARRMYVGALVPAVVVPLSSMATADVKCDVIAAVCLWF